ncbi:MAG: peptidoglycan DD-metalloendopeptidase family protein [Rhodospirillales bacterium]|nr:peptidoglycan DD-metalloendopeptidase family protein [Rhodospirillales bacterium]
MRQVMVRTATGVRFLTIKPWAQRVVALSFLLFFGATMWMTVGHQAALRYADMQRDEVSRLEQAYRTALDSLAPSVDSAAEIGRAESANVVLSLVDQNERLREKLSELESRLDSAETERERASAAHETLVVQLRQIEQQVRKEQSRNTQLGSAATEIDRQLADALAERGRLAVERDRLAREKKRLAGEIDALKRDKGALPAAQEAALVQMIEKTRSSVDTLTRIVKRTGLDPDRVLAVSATTGLGGPFIDARVATKEEATQQVGLLSLGWHIGRLTDLQRLLRAMPVLPPLDQYAVMSGFGIRTDPINGQSAMHYGVDLRSPARTPIKVPAPGIVVFAARNGDHGNMVEIDHGFGLRTRYGHLSRIEVKVGQRIAARHTIGLVGSTGRSTGPHLHYEILSDGKNLDPVKFLEAAKYVLKS